MPNGAFQIAAVIAATYTASKVRRSRLIIIVVGYLFALIGILLVKELPTSNRYGRLVGCWMMILFSSAFPLLLSLMASSKLNPAMSFSIIYLSTSCGLTPLHRHSRIHQENHRQCYLFHRILCWQHWRASAIQIRRSTKLPRMDSLAYHSIAEN